MVYEVGVGVYWMALLVVSFLDLDFGFGFVGSKPFSSFFFFFGLDHPSWNTRWHFFPSTFLAYPLAWGALHGRLLHFWGVGLIPPFF